MVAGEVTVNDDMVVESPEVLDEFMVTDKQGNEVAMEEVASIQENVV
jgi:hypothetical protein